MIHLISVDGETVSPNICPADETIQAVVKCLSFLKNALALDAKLSKFDSSSTSFSLLTQMAKTQNFIEFRSKIFLPINRPDNTIWGFIEISCQTHKPSPAKIRKSIQALSDIVQPVIQTSQDIHLEQNYSLLVLESSVSESHRISSGLFHNRNFTSFINVKEWIEQDQKFSLGSLREFTDSLLYVPEVLDLTPSQRSVLALYSLLPEQLQSSTLLVCTAASNSKLESSLAEEKSFLSAYKSKKTLFDKNFEKRLPS